MSESSASDIPDFLQGGLANVRAHAEERQKAEVLAELDRAKTESSAT